MESQFIQFNDDLKLVLRKDLIAYALIKSSGARYFLMVTLTNGNTLNLAYKGDENPREMCDHAAYKDLIRISNI